MEVLEKHSLFREQTELVMQIPEDSFSPSATVASNLQSMADLGLTDAEEETFAQLYGMPGTILRLIARTNNMITQLDPPELHGTVQPVVPEDLIEAAAALENDICKFKQTSTSCHDLTPMDGRGSIVTGADASQMMRSHFTTAMHHALLVYFFRFVRGTNPIILQHYVGSVISNLESFQKRKEGAFSGVRIGTTVWPSFIAACEALGDDLRDRAKRCMRHAAWAGFKNAEAAEAVAQEVWRRRDQGEKDVSWSTVLRDSGTILLLT